MKGRVYLELDGVSSSRCRFSYSAPGTPSSQHIDCAIF